MCIFVVNGARIVRRRVVLRVLVPRGLSLTGSRRCVCRGGCATWFGSLFTSRLGGSSAKRQSQDAGSEDRYSEDSCIHNFLRSIEN
jgi:hypothetical protein